MPYTREQEAEFKEQFAARRKRQVMLAVLLVAIVLAVVIAEDSIDQGLFGIPPAIIGGGFVIIVAVALIFSFRNWRCPACDRYLGRQLSPRFCAACGVALQ